MATKKNVSRAQKAVSEAKKKSDGKTADKSGAKNSAASKTSESVIPANIIVGVICLALFVVFLVTAVNPTGALLKVIETVMVGLIGKAGFYFSIPALLYMFIIHIFSPKTAVKMRSICLISFVLLCGCISHLAIQTGSLSGGFGFISDLFKGGSEGYTAGVICGCIAELLRWAITDILSYIVLVLGAVLTLLGALQITVPSLVRAIKNRPREELEEEEEEEPQIEPAAIVVNHLANKQIEYKRQKRLRLEQAQLQSEVPAQAETPVNPPKQSPRKPSAKANDLMNQIDEIGSPVAAAAEFVTEEAAPVRPAPVPATPIPVEPEPIPKEMPPYKREESLPAAPKTAEPASVPAPEIKKEKVTAKDAAVSAQQVANEIAEASAVARPEYCFPPIDLLNRPGRGVQDGTLEMRENSRRLNETLASFKIDAHIVNVTRGPSVTRYEVELEKGVRLNKLTTCADDIALSLGASGVRIAAVPGKISVVGIEVPNRAVTTVTLREVIDSGEFNKSKSKSSFAVGKDIGGSCIVGNIAKMPHMLIAGTTGSGKSVCMNSIIISLLYKASPEDVKLIMVDPKMVELGIYNGIPHLLIPVVTDPKKAAGSLQWAVTEMMRRYKIMSDAGVRDLESYNSIAMSEEDGQKLPQIVIIIDELADLMLVAAKEVEDSICRIAQMGRAAGMHLIIATQRPSADVITGLMKANIPSRIAFAVASAMESRIILDTQGAEKLVGKGDMLYAPIGNGKPLRVQGCFVSDSEVEAVSSYVKENYTAEYNQQVLEDIEKKAQQTGKKAASVSDPEPSAEELDGDEMLPQAVDVILETGQASVSMLQRRLKLGYARAARIVDEMEEKGIVGPFQGSKPRAILITKEQWAARNGGQDQQLEFADLEEDMGGVPEDF